MHLKDRFIAFVKLPHVGANNVEQFEARAAFIARAVGEQHGCCATPKQAVGEKHRAVIPTVPETVEG